MSFSQPNCKSKAQKDQEGQAASSSRQCRCVAIGLEEHQDHSHGPRFQRAVAVAFAQGSAAEKLAAKQRRGAKRANKQDAKRRSKAMRRMSRRRRAGH
mmetsp:Transcript_48320/g.126343  ORF Transcript_48320/g.126343 Transcript_48320/m.126343 type:complete len:98 (-) Transcript_48320:785-1078(-)